MSTIGELGLAYSVAGQIVQALGRCIIDREIEGIGEEQVVAYLESDDFNEDRLWFDLAPIVDRLEEQISDWLARSQQPIQECGEALYDSTGRLRARCAEPFGIEHSHSDVNWGGAPLN